MIYKLINDDEGNTSTIKLTQNDGAEWFIPLDDSNTMYQEYLEWVAEGNEPEPADE